MSRTVQFARRTLSQCFFSFLFVPFSFVAFSQDAWADIHKLVAAGEATPIGGTYSSSLPPTVLGISDDSEVLFWSGVDGGSSDAAVFLFSAGAARSVVANGDRSPLSGTFSNIGLTTARLNNHGNVAFAAEITGGSAPQGLFFWQRPLPALPGAITKVVAAGDRAPRPFLIDPVTDPDVFTSDFTFDLNDADQITFHALQGKQSPVTTVSKAGIYLWTAGSIMRIVNGGLSTPIGALDLSSGNLGPFLNNNLQSALWALADFTRESIFVCAVGNCNKVVTVGDVTPGGMWLAHSGPCCILGFNDAGKVVLPSPTPGGEVFLWSSGAFQHLSGPGDAVVNPAGQTLAGVFAAEIHLRRRALNNLDEFAFIGTLQSAGPVISGVFVNSQGATAKAALSGEAAPGTPGTFAGFDSLAINDTGCLAFSGISSPPFLDALWLADFPTFPGRTTRSCNALQGRIFVDLTRPGGVKVNPSGFYTDQLPLRRAHVLLEDASGRVTGDTYTRDNGRYSFPVPPAGQQVRLRVNLEDHDALIRVLDISRDPVNVAFARTQSFTPPAGVAQDFRMRIGVGGGLNTTLYDPPLDAVNPTNSTTARFAHLAYTYHNIAFGKSVAAILPVVRSEEVHGYSLQNTSHSCPGHQIEILLADSDANDPDRDRPFFDFHEYGHHIVCASPIAGVENEPATGDVGNHRGIANTTSSDSWKEGLASFFAAVDAQQGGDPQSNVFIFAGGRPLDLEAGGARLDDPRAPGWNMTFGALGEEFAISSVLWDLHRRLGLFNQLWPVLRANMPDLQTWKAFHDATKVFEAANPTAFADLTGDRCTFNGNLVAGVDCLFVERGFYKDANGDGLYSAGEEVGVTRWDGTPPRGPAVRRPKVPDIFGGTTLLSVVDASTGAPLTGVQFQIQIQYDPPLDDHNLTWTIDTDGGSPFRVPVTVPGTPSRAILIAQKAGYKDSDPLTIESAFYHDRINPFRPGGVSEILLQQTFRLIPIAVVDTTPPATIAASSPPPNANDWNNTNVTVALNSVDNSGGSGVKQITITLSGAQTRSVVAPGGTASVAVTAEGVTTVAYFGTDNAGNQETPKTLTVRIDRTPPAATATIAPVPNTNGWNNTNVTVSFTGTDAFSGIASCTAPISLISEGAAQSVSGTCIDKAGNISSPAKATVKIDKTSPVISGMPAVGCTLWPPNQKLVQVATVTATDALSGLAPGTFKVTGVSNEPVEPADPRNPDILITPTAAGGFIVQLRAERSGTGTGRIYTLTATANDLAGNTRTSTATCTVPHDRGN
jgi:hypothetical protein